MPEKRDVRLIVCFDLRTYDDPLEDAYRQLKGVMEGDGTVEEHGIGWETSDEFYVSDEDGNFPDDAGDPRELQAAIVKVLNE